MIRRSRTPLAVLAVVLWLGGIAHAGRMITYELQNTGGPSAPPVTQIFAYVHPADSVGPDPKAPDVSPFNVLPGSNGFNANNLISFLGDGTLNTGEPIQVLRLQFDSSGFAAANGDLKFSVALAPSYTGPDPTLQLVPGTTGVSLNPYTPPTNGTTPGSGSGSGGSGSSSGGGGGTSNVPEPVSIVLWSAAAGLGLLRALRRGGRGLT